MADFSVSHSPVSSGAPSIKMQRKAMQQIKQQERRDGSLGTVETVQLPVAPPHVRCNLLSRFTEAESSSPNPSPSPSPSVYRSRSNSTSPCTPRGQIIPVTSVTTIIHRTPPGAPMKAKMPRTPPRETTISRRTTTTPPGAPLKAKMPRTPPREATISRRTTTTTPPGAPLKAKRPSASRGAI